MATEPRMTLELVVIRGERATARSPSTKKAARRRTYAIAHYIAGSE